MRYRSITTAILTTLAAHPALSAPAPAPAPATAPAVSPRAATGPQEQAIDPQRLTVGREIASALWPNGTAEKMMAEMGGMQSGMMKGVFDKKPKDFGIKGGKESDKTLGEAIKEKDPYFEERMIITNKVMMEEIGKLMGGFEPQMREALATIYAKHFTLAELRDIAAFLRSPSGKNFGAQMIPMMADPDYVNVMTKLMPKLVEALPSIMEKVQKATAHLPPVPDEEKSKPAELPAT